MLAGSAGHLLNEFVHSLQSRQDFILSMARSRPGKPHTFYPNAAGWQPGRAGRGGLAYGAGSQPAPPRPVQSYGHDEHLVPSRTAALVGVRTASRRARSPGPRPTPAARPNGWPHSRKTWRVPPAATRFAAGCGATGLSTRPTHSSPLGKLDSPTSCTRCSPAA